jgi:hypothetical protein
MSHNRFKEILTSIRFDDMDTREARKQSDRLTPLREVTDVFKGTCKIMYTASPYGTIDEQLVTIQGRCAFKVYMPNKPGKYGIKVWVLCDAKTFYCCNFPVYLESTGNAPERNQGARVVQDLAFLWKNSGRNVTTDNIFTDISLAEDHLKINITLLGTIRKTRKDLPKLLVQMVNRATFSSQFLFNRNITLVSSVPKPRTCVVALSSMHHEHSISDENNKFKPDIILDYNKTKSGVDILDKLVCEYTCRRGMRTWPLSLFLNYVDIAAYNAFVILRMNVDGARDVQPLIKQQKQFLETLGKHLLQPNINRR